MAFRDLLEPAQSCSGFQVHRHENKDAKVRKLTSWSIRADVVRKLDRSEPEPEVRAVSGYNNEEALMRAFLQLAQFEPVLA